MLSDSEPNTPEDDAYKKLKKSIDALMKKFQDFNIMASTMDSDAPVRDAYKAVFGEDRPEYDPNTPEGMRRKNEMNAYIGRGNE